MSRILLAIVALASLALIGGGLWVLHPAAGMIAVGVLVWLDLQIRDRKR